MNSVTVSVKLTYLLFFLIPGLLACKLGDSALGGSNPTSTVVVVKFSTTEPTLTASALPTPSPAATITPDETAGSTPTFTSVPEPASTPESSPTPEPLPTPTPIVTAAPPTNTPTPEPTSAPAVDFVVRRVWLRTNEENSWDGTLNQGYCGSDHSIYVHVADTQENLLDGILVGDKFGNFEVPTGVDGPGQVRILVWSATMKLAVMGHEDGTRYTSEFTPPLSTLDEDIPLDWLEEAGYCESPEDCQRRVENNQLCRGHYSYDVIFQRTW